ncbi:MAG: cation:proton antiporter [Candidatus Thorarchaeota archaeon]
MADVLPLYLIAAVLIGGVALAKVSETYRFPYPIPLIIAGILLGQANEVFPFFPIDIDVSFIAQLTLACVLFYAGLTMNLKETNRARTSIILLATLGVLLTSVITGVTMFYITPAVGTILPLALLIGAIVSPTDPAALFSVLESGGVRVKRKLFTLLEGEAVFNDATAVVLVTTVFEPLIVPGIYGEAQIEWYIIFIDFILSMGLGVVIGFAVAYGLGRLINSTAGDTNVSILTATTPIFAYGIGEAIASIVPGVHPGALAAVFAGIFMANSRMVSVPFLPQKSMRGVMKNVSFFFEIVVYILLGLTLNTVQLIARPDLLFAGLVVGMLVIFVARPVSVFAVTLQDKTVGFKERFLLSWAGVKGVASAALAAIVVAVITSVDHAADVEILWGISAQEIGLTINSIVFIVILMSLFIQGLTTPILTTMLGLVEEQDRAQEITAERNAIRQSLLHLVDQYTEGKVDSRLYSLLKMELEEQIFHLEDELRKLVAERRARLRELEIRHNLAQKKLEFYSAEYEAGRISDTTFEDMKAELEADIDELAAHMKSAQASAPKKSEES